MVRTLASLWRPLIVTVFVASLMVGPTFADAASESTGSASKVFFGSAASTGGEGDKVSLTVKLGSAARETVKVDYVVSGGTASKTGLGSGRDYVLQPGTLTFEPGAITKKISLNVNDDSINEANEDVGVRLLDPRGAALGSDSTHTHQIVDDDRNALVKVTDFGATGKDATDDTAEIQEAIRAVDRRGGGVVVFPRGTYFVKSVIIKPNITYVGYGATIKRPPQQPNWTRTFDADYSGKHDSRPLIVQGLTFDGNSRNQGPYRNYQLEQAHLIFLMGEDDRRGRLQAVVEDSKFRNGVADGISVYTNVDAKVHNCEATDVFRGGFVLTGGYTSAKVTDLVTAGKTDPTGIDIEVDGDGFGGTYQTDVQLQNLRLQDGDFDVAVSDGSTVTGSNIHSTDAPMYIYSEGSKMRFTDSEFFVGYPDGYSNRIVYPKNVTFEDSTFTVTEEVDDKPNAPEANRELVVADVYWNFDWDEGPRKKNQSLVFKDNVFKVDGNVEAGDRVYLAETFWNNPNHNNVVTFDGGKVSSAFDRNFASDCVRCVRNP